MISSLKCVGDSVEFENKRLFYADLVYGIFKIPLKTPYNSTQFYAPSTPTTSGMQVMITYSQ